MFLGGTMKKLSKTLVLALAAIFLTTSLSAATVSEGDAAQTSFNLASNKQYGDNYETQGKTGNILPKDYVAKKGDKITIHVEATVDKDIILGERKGESSAAELLFVDGTAAAGYWLELTDRIKITDTVKAGDKIVWDYTFEVKADGKSKAGDGGCRWVISSAPQQKTAVKLTATKFTYKIER